MKTKYAWIYDVECKGITVTGWDKYGAYIQYKVRNGRKVHKCWIDLNTARYLKAEGFIS